MLAAIEAEDFEELARAVEDRGAAIEAGAAPAEREIEAGERAALALVALKHRLAFESARLNRIQVGLAGLLPPRPGRVDVRA